MEEVQFMKKAYGLFYEIENSLRDIIIRTMENEYGIDWHIKAPLSMNYKPYSKKIPAFYYHELISFIAGYPCFTPLFSNLSIVQLRETIPIRNKIAHCKIITQEEYNKLNNTHFYIIIYVLNNCKEIKV